MNSLDEEVEPKTDFWWVLQTCRIRCDLHGKRHGRGAVMPAHVDRESFSMLYTFGSIPEEYGFSIWNAPGTAGLTVSSRKGDLTSYDFIRSSDAHYLHDILERESWLELEEKSGMPFGQAEQYCCKKMS